VTSRAHVLVSGRVQGVGFRWFARRSAQTHGVRGWCANLSDGRVEIVAEGERAALEAFTAELRLGPPAARVERCTVELDAPFDELALSSTRIALAPAQRDQ
jgi:acylphosphatase